MDGFSYVALPAWTENRQKGGLDPLGMQNISINLYQKLVPGISNVTLRMRYYGLYAWLSSAYSASIRETDLKQWQRFVRRAEALYALIAQKKGNETGVAGTEWAERKLGESNDVINFETDAEPGSQTHYLKQPWGVYGAAYASQLHEIGILSVAASHQIPVPSKEIGEALAKEFSKAIGSVAEKFLQVMDKGVVTHKELEGLACMAPSSINPHSEESQCYQDILFKTREFNAVKDTDRSQTLLLILSIAQQLRREPIPYDIRWALYAGQTQDGTCLNWPVPELLQHQKRWWIYHANDLMHICLEGLLKYLLDRLESYPSGIALARLISEAVKQMLDVSLLKPLTWAAFLEHTPLELNAWSADKNPLAEDVLAKRLISVTSKKNGSCSPEQIWCALQLLAILHHQFRHKEKEIEVALSGFNLSYSQTLLTEMRFLEKHKDEDFTSTICRLVEQRVIKRHMWVALNKFKYQGDYTFLIESDDGLIRLRAKDGPTYTNPRLGPAITFLKDIHLLDKNGITPEGEKLLKALV